MEVIIIERVTHPKTLKQLDNSELLIYMCTFVEQKCEIL